jgi:GNAT superfamily N-acetyltransferase
MAEGESDRPAARPDVRAVIRAAEPSDVAALARLAGELGYPTDTEQMAHRLADLPASDDVWVAILDGEVVGWVHCAVCRTLVLDPHLEVMALVVGEGRRGLGIGRLLMEAAERSARDRGVSTIRLRSNVVREGAHAFYGQLGYREQKRSTLFAKELNR